MLVANETDITHHLALNITSKLLNKYITFTLSYSRVHE